MQVHRRPGGDTASRRCHKHTFCQVATHSHSAATRQAIRATAGRTLSIAQLDIAVRKNWESHIDASHSRQPLIKGERLVRYEVNAVILLRCVTKPANQFNCGGALTIPCGVEQHRAKPKQRAFISDRGRGCKRQTNTRGTKLNTYY